MDEEVPKRVRPRTTAELLATGVTPRQLRGSKWQPSSRGMWVPAGVDTTAVDQRVIQQAVRLPPDGAVGGWAAARAHGADQCDGVAPDGRTVLPVLLCIGTERRIRAGAGSELSRDPLPEDDVVEIHGVRYTAEPRTCFDGMRLATDLVEAVVFADLMLHAALLTITEMQDYIATHCGWRGVPQARAALGLADPGSRNGWESRMRMVWVLDAGLPRPLCNPPIFDLCGQLLGYPDLLDVSSATVLEYDGREHRRAIRHDRDNLREELFEEHGLVVARVTHIDFSHHDDLARRMQRTRRRALGRDRRQDRWSLTVPPAWGSHSGTADDELEALLAAMDADWSRRAT